MNTTKNSIELKEIVQLKNELIVNQTRRIKLLEDKLDDTKSNKKEKLNSKIIPAGTQQETGLTNGQKVNPSENQNRRD